MRGFWGVALLLLAAGASAKEKLVPLSETDAAALRGKTVALTVHKRPSFTAGTAGKATFGLFGAGAMIAAGNKLVDENGVQDPAVLVRDQLVRLLRDTYGANVLEVDTQATEATKPKEIAALHPQSDYVLDVRSTGWMFFYYPSDWNSYWVNYTVQSQLVDAKNARQVSNMACRADTRKSPVRPSREQLIDDKAQLLKDVTQHLGWICTQMFATEQYRIAAEQVPAIPAEYEDPMARLATPVAATATTAAAATVDTTARTGIDGAQSAEAAVEAETGVTQDAGEATHSPASEPAAYRPATEPAAAAPVP